MIRRLSISILTLVAMVLVLSAVTQAQSFAPFTHHVRDVVANGQAHSVGKLPASQTMRLTLVLPLRNQTQLDEFLKNVSDPSSPYFRQFLTVEEFTSLFGPTQEDYNKVIDFAKANGLTVEATSRNRVNLDVSGPVSAIEKAFHVTMGVYQHPT